MIVKYKNQQVEIDLMRLSVSDMRDFFDKTAELHKKEKADLGADNKAEIEKQDRLLGDAIQAKACGISIEELSALPYPLWRKVNKAFWKLVNDPLADDDEKNSVSESTSD